MSLLGALCKPKSLPVLSKSLRSVTMIHDLPNLLHCLSNQTRPRKDRDSRSSSCLSKAQSLEDVFVNSLVAASACEQHSHRHHGLAGWTRRPGPSRGRASQRYSWQRQYASKAADTKAMIEKQDQEKRYTRDELRGLVETYPSPSDLWHLGADPSIMPEVDGQRQHFPLAPRMVLPPEVEDVPPYAERIVMPPVDRHHAHQLRRFHELLRCENGHISLAKLWEDYQELQRPALRYITDSAIHKMFRHLSWVEYKHEPGAYDRYLTFLEECLGEQIKVKAEEWNTAVSFAGRWKRTVADDEVKSAIEVWIRMEKHGVPATHETFNILFDLAVKAGRYALADTIYNELVSRGLTLNRYFRTSVIDYAGVRGDGDAVRQAFRDLVNAGEVVDTVVMNCVIVSLIRAGEPAAAENVFIKMKRLYEQKLGAAAPTKWQDFRALGHKLDAEARRLREERTIHESSFFGSGFASNSRKEEVQRSTPIAPNERTYRIFIKHHVQTSGRIDQITSLLAEMKERGLNIHGSIYYAIFGGYWQHGGYAFSTWTPQSLEAFWKEFVASVKRGASSKPERDMSEYSDEPLSTELEQPPYFTRDLVIAVIAAFYKCAGTERMTDVWKQVKRDWPGMTEEQRIRIGALVQKFIREDSVYATDAQTV